MSECKCVVHEMAAGGEYVALGGTALAVKDCRDCGGTGDWLLKKERDLAAVFRTEQPGPYSTRTVTDKDVDANGKVTAVRSTTIGVSSGAPFATLDSAAAAKHHAEGDPVRLLIGTSPPVPALTTEQVRKALGGDFAGSEDVRGAKVVTVLKDLLAAADGGLIKAGHMVVWSGTPPTAKQIAEWEAAPAHILPMGTEVQVIAPGESAERHGWTVHNKTTGGHSVTLGGPEPDPVDAFRALLEACYMPAMIELARQRWQSLNPAGRFSWDVIGVQTVSCVFSLGSLRVEKYLYRDFDEGVVDGTIRNVAREMGPALVEAWKPAVRR